MSANSTNPFPAPVGGVPDALDFAPSVFFAVLYALMAPIVIWRMAHPRSRNTVLLTTSLFSIERVVLFSLRAAAARDATFRPNIDLETYFQASASGGFVSIGHDVVNVLRALLVSSTLGGDMLARHKLTPPHVRKAQKETETETEKEAGSYTALALAPPNTARGEGHGQRMYQVELGVDRDGACSSSTTCVGGPDVEFADQTKLRRTIRTWLSVTSLLFLAAVAVSSVAGANYKNAIKGNSGAGDLVRSLWYASTVLTIVLLVAAAITALFAPYKLPRVPRTSALWIVLVTCLLSIVGIYRIAVISHSTTSIFSTAPGSQNTPCNKAAFYVLHAAPEFVSTALLVSLNARRVFGTGPWGDLRPRDPKSKAAPEGESRSAGSQV
ncbi:hypothetical protein GSI_04159 [Ganoderma sinense ZZ0214-1]|uniref:Uncharacterized protein n=1 Tax=Ganoderma sinense ZZ0214-1 TaxID=1077348 RepID=A0A2G8SID7_9APHY|nr:hypothetical protein GSI_04159 [Ganoderma sinense ZZ0214-1]